MLLELVEDLASFGRVRGEGRVVVEEGDGGRSEREGEELGEGGLDFERPEGGWGRGEEAGGMRRSWGRERRRRNERERGQLRTISSRLPPSTETNESKAEHITHGKVNTNCLNMNFKNGRSGSGFDLVFPSSAPGICS